MRVTGIPMKPSIDAGSGHRAICGLDENIYLPVTPAAAPRLFALSNTDSLRHLIMAQNIYDTEDFFQEYSKLPRSVHGLDRAPEWPTLRRLLGDIQGSSVLDLGCGFGWFSRWAIEQGGASSVHGIDVSQNMLARAKEMTKTPAITYERADLEGIELRKESYDVVYSSLVLHYLPDPNQLVSQVRQTLRPGGRFVFSLEHPIATAPSEPEWKWDENEKVYWPLNGYLNEGLRVTEWLRPGVRKYHRSIETYLGILLQNGFVITGYRDSHDGMERHNDPKRRGECHRPYFLLLAAAVPPKS